MGIKMLDSIVWIKGTAKGKSSGEIGANQTSHISNIYYSPPEGALAIRYLVPSMYRVKQVPMPVPMPAATHTCT